MPRLLMLLTALFLLSAPQAEAGLMRWSVLYLDANGNAVNYGKHSNAEAWIENQQGFQFAIGCEGGDYRIYWTAPKDEKANWAGDYFEPSVRVHKPGTDLFLGPTGKMTFDGKRYVGPMHTQVMDALLTEGESDLTVAIVEFITKKTTIFPVQRVERIMNELPCLHTK
ncbi:MAG: hypothetical protein AAFV19_03170 [Pseudomonadota bacterium]